MSTLHVALLSTTLTVAVARMNGLQPTIERKMPVAYPGDPVVVPVEDERPYLPQFFQAQFHKGTIKPESLGYKALSILPGAEACQPFLAGQHEIA